MLSRFFGKRDKPDDSPPKEVKAARGLEVTEDEPDAAWKKWDRAKTEQDSRAVNPAPVARAPAAPTPPIARTPAPAPQATAPVRRAPPVVTARSPASPRPSAPPAAPAPSLDFVLPTAPMPLQEMTLEQRKKVALEVVDLHHHRIANTIRTLWGYKECSAYINKLIMAGGDGMGHARVGFNQDAVDAMLALSDIHDAEFGPPDSIVGGLGLSL